MSFAVPDPHSVHVEVSATASESEVEAAIHEALYSNFVDLTSPAKDELIIHVKFGP